MSEQKLKTYRFDAKIRNKETNKIAKKQFNVVAYGIKEAKELFEIATEHSQVFKNLELIEISVIKRISNNKWPNYTLDYYKVLTEMRERAKGKK